jgi:hypothetical protein
VTQTFPQTVADGLTQMLKITIPDIPLTGALTYSRQYTPDGADAPLTATVVIGTNNSAAFVSVSGQNLNWLIPGAHFTPQGTRPATLDSFGFGSVIETAPPPMTIDNVCKPIGEFVFDAENPDQAVGSWSNGGFQSPFFCEGAVTLTVKFSDK